MGESKFEGPQGAEKLPEDELREWEERRKRVHQEFRDLLRDSGINVDEDILKKIESGGIQDSVFVSGVRGKKFDMIQTLVHLRDILFLRSNEDLRKDTIERYLKQLKSLV